MATVGFDPSAELLALRGLFAQCTAATDDAESSLLRELDEIDALCRQFATNCKNLCSAARDVSEEPTTGQDALAALDNAEPIQAVPPDDDESDAEADLKELQLEMEQLRAELKTARRRLSDEKRKSNSDRDGWASELDGLRKLLEPARPANESPQAAPVAEPVRKARAPAAASSDPVLGAVLAQFEKLQQTGAPD